MVIFGILFTLLAVATDTAFYTGPASTSSFGALLWHLLNAPVITPLNNLRYNSQNSNLALHGLHPHYQHFIINLPQLLGPAMVPLLTWLQPFRPSKLDAILANTPLTSALTGTLILSFIPHQEPRFLIPCIPLLLTCIRLPSSAFWRRNFWISWIIFNSLMAVLMGVYHQGGVIPAQIAMPKVIKSANTSEVTVFWWKTYPAPTYLIGAPSLDVELTKPISVTTTPLMGLSEHDLKQTLLNSSYAADCTGHEQRSSAESSIFLAAPISAHLFDNTDADRTEVLSLRGKAELVSDRTLLLTKQYLYRRHINLDDLDFAEDGVFGTLGRVFGRPGLGIWRVRTDCAEL